MQSRRKKNSHDHVDSNQTDQNMFIHLDSQKGVYVEPRKNKFGEKQKGDNRKFLEIVGVVAIFFGIVFLLIRALFAFVGYPVEVIGYSMTPTLQDKERVFTNRNGNIERFNIVVFHPLDDENKRLIKRVIGMPGDTLYYKNDQLYINGNAYTEPYLKEYKKKLTNKELLTNDFTLYSVTGYKQIPENYYFVLGDNRQNSKDSRQFSVIKKNQIEGTVNYRLYPFSRMGQIAPWAN